MNLNNIILIRSIIFICNFTFNNNIIIEIVNNLLRIPHTDDLIHKIFLLFFITSIVSNTDLFTYENMSVFSNSYCL